MDETHKQNIEDLVNLTVAEFEYGQSDDTTLEQWKQEVRDLISQLESEVRSDERKKIMQEMGAVFVTWSPEEVEELINGKDSKKIPKLNFGKMPELQVPPQKDEEYSVKVTTGHTKLPKDVDKLLDHMNEKLT